MITNRQHNSILIKGEYSWPNGVVYNGSWVNGFKDGYGVESSKGGKYKGEWINGKKNGKGWRSRIKKMHLYSLCLNYTFIYKRSFNLCR